MTNVCCLIRFFAFFSDNLASYQIGKLIGDFLAVAMSAMVQFRTMGGAIGLAIVTTVLNSYIKSELAQYISPDQIASLLETAEAFKSLPPDIINLVKGVFARGYNLQVEIMIGFAAAQIPASFLMWKKNQILV